MNNISDNELYELCVSNDLSFDALQETIDRLGPHLLSQNPSYFHEVCRNKNVTLEIIQLVYNTLPGALRLRDDDYRDLPIHYLCLNKGLDDAASIDILRFMLEIDPNLPREVDGEDFLPLHHAAQFKSTAFCKELIDAYPESLAVRTRIGSLPIHLASTNGKREDTADTIQYMLELDPELINAEDGDGYLPIHIAAMNGRTKSIELLLKFNPDSASKETNDEYRRLPLHISCESTNLSSVRVLYDAYPDAIFARDEQGDTPLDDARVEMNQPAIEFLQTQLVYARQAQDMTAMTTPDDNGWLPLHHALKGNASLGSIKLLVRGNPSALRVMDNSYAFPLHIACEFSSVTVVQFLVQWNQVILNHVDAKHNSPLHYACRWGNLGIVKYLIQANVPSVSERNNEKKLAIHLLFECGENTLGRKGMEYVETVWLLLLANPEVVRDFMPN